MELDLYHDIIFVGSEASALALTVTHAKCELSVESPKCTEFVNVHDVFL